MRELENDQHVSLEANVFRFPFIFFNLSGFRTLLVTTCLLRGLFTVPLKGKLTVSTRSWKYDSRVAKVETFEFRDARIEARESRVENQESRKMDFGICINSRSTRENDLCLKEMNNSANGAFVRNIHVDSKQAFNVLGP